MRGLPLVNWCCMCRSNGELVDHLLLYCDVVHALWVDIFYISRIHWVMPSSIVTLLVYWRNWFGKHGSDIWNMATGCLMWIVWKERNHCLFKDTEISLDQLKSGTSTLFLIGQGVGGSSNCLSTLEFLVSLRPVTSYSCIVFFFVPLCSSS